MKSLVDHFYSIRMILSDGRAGPWYNAGWFESEKQFKAWASKHGHISKKTPQFRWEIAEDGNIIKQILKVEPVTEEVVPEVPAIEDSNGQI